MSKNEATGASPEKITFEDGYEELKAIAAKLNGEDVPMHELFDLLRRGKGLDKSLREYLETQKGALEEIEAGKSITQFEIVAPSKPDAENDASPEGEIPF